MTRTELINFILSSIEGKNYLEIGIRDARNMSRIKAKKRVGVDPAYIISRSIDWKYKLGIANLKLFKITSDEFFEKHAAHVFSDGIDVAFIDGLHNYDQSLRDIENSLKYLNPKGYIVVHDCNPANAADAFPVKHSFAELEHKLQTDGIPGWTGAWNGDVWKSIAHLRSSRPDLKICTVDSDYGMGVISFSRDQPVLDLEVTSIADLDFDYFDRNRNELLNLVSADKFIKEFKS